MTPQRLLLTAAGFLLITSSLLAGDTSKAAPAPAPTAAATGHETDVVLMENGTWDADIEFPPEEEGKEPGHAKGVQINSMVQGKKFIKNEFSVNGTEYGGHGVWGWDTQKKKYVGIWVDANQDYVRFDEGTWDAATKTMTWWSDCPHPQGGTYKQRMIETFGEGVRTLTITAIGPKSGKEQLLVSMKFTLRKG